MPKKRPDITNEELAALQQSIQTQQFTYAKPPVATIPTTDDHTTHADAPAVVVPDFNAYFMCATASPEPSTPPPTTPNTYDDPVCTACNVGILQPHDGFLTCPTCGTQGEACIESGAEWRSFGAEDAKVSDPARCGSSTATYLSKDDASKNADASGSQISCRWRESRKMRTARMMQGWSLANPNTRTFRKDIREKKCLLYTKGYTSLIVDDAVHRFVEIKKLEAKKNIKCRSENNQGLWAYCVKETCKKHGVPRSVKEICADLGLTNQVMTRGHAVYVKARKEADAHDHKVNESTNIKKDVDQPHDFVPRFCSKLGLSDSVRRDVHNVTVVTKQCGLVPDKPALIAAACILFVVNHHNLPYTSSDIQKVVGGTSHVTISKCYKERLKGFAPFLVQHIGLATEAEPC